MESPSHREVDGGPKLIYVSSNVCNIIPFSAEPIMVFKAEETFSWASCVAQDLFPEHDFA